MKRELKVWLLVAAVGAIVVLGGLAIYPLLTPDDAMGLARSLALRVSTMVIGFVFILLALIAFDTVTPGWWLESIKGHPEEEAFVVGVLILSLALLFMYS